MLGAVVAVVFGCTSSGPQGPAVSSTGMVGGPSASSEAVSSGLMADSSGGVGSVTSSSTNASTSSSATGAVGCGDIQGEGFAVGQISSNWTLLDASGAPVELYDYCGQVIYLESGSEW